MHVNSQRCVETYIAVAVQSRVSLCTCVSLVHHTFTNSCDFLRWLPAIHPLRIGQLFFIGISRSVLHLSCCDKYLKRARGYRQNWQRRQSQTCVFVCVCLCARFISSNNRGHTYGQHCSIVRRERMRGRESEKEMSVYAPRAISQTQIFESIGSTLLCRHLGTHYIRSAGFISDSTLHWFNPWFYIETCTTVCRIYRIDNRRRKEEETKRFHWCCSLFIFDVNYPSELNKFVWRQIANNERARR